MDRTSILDFIPTEEHAAIKNGTSTFNCAPAFNEALNSGNQILVPSGVYNLNSIASNSAAVDIVNVVQVDVFCEPGVRFVAGNIAHNGFGVPVKVDFFRFWDDTLGYGSIGSARDHRIKWVGGYFDSTALTTAYGTGISLGGPSWFEILRCHVHFEDMVFDTGFKSPTGAGTVEQRLGCGFMDAAINTHFCHGETYRNCLFIGFADLGIYTSGNTDGTDYLTGDPKGEMGLVDRCTFYRCKNGVSSKRAFRGMTVTNCRFSEGYKGYVASNGVNTANHGRYNRIIDCTFTKMQGTPIELHGHWGDVVRGCTFENWGGTLFSNASSPTNGTQAISLSSNRGAVITENTFRLVGTWLPDGPARCAVEFANDAEYNTHATEYCIVEGNVLVDVPKPFNEIAGNNNNTIRDNVIVGGVTASTFDGLATNVSAVQSNKADQLHVISDGAIALRGGPFARVGTVSGAGTLRTITGGKAGDVITLSSNNSSNDITVEHGTGNIQCGVNRVLSSVNDTITLVKSSVAWRLVAFADNAT